MSTLRLAAKLASRELRGGLPGFRIFPACPILGVAPAAAVELRLFGGDAAAGTGEDQHGASFAARVAGTKKGRTHEASGPVDR